MLILAATTDKIQLVTDTAVTVDVHATYIDCSDASPPVVDAPNKQNTAITTAATTDIVAAPGANKRRNVKTIHIRNKHGTASVNITPVFDQNGTDFELHKVTLKAGESLEYIEGIGWFALKGSGDGDMNNSNTADVVASAADTYLSGSSVIIANRVKAGTLFRWRMRASKTAAGTAAPTWNLRVGTAGSTADTARCILSSASGSPVQPVQTAAADEGWFELEAIIRTFSASGIIQLTAFFTHRLATTGFANIQVGSYAVTSAAFDLTVASLILGLSVNPGTAGVWTFQNIGLDTINHL